MQNLRVSCFMNLSMVEKEEKSKQSRKEICMLRDSKHKFQLLEKKERGNGNIVMSYRDVILKISAVSNLAIKSTGKLVGSFDSTRMVRFVFCFSWC